MKKPLFNFGPPKRVTKKDKKLTYKQAKKKHNLAPFGDADRDGYLNIFDCKPLNPKKHGVTKTRKDIKHQVYDSSKGFMTEGEIFTEAEKLMPEEFGEEKGTERGEYSEQLTDALRYRKRAEEREGDTVVKKIAGIHKPVRPGSVSYETAFAHHHLKKHLLTTYPEKQFKFDVYKPGTVKVRREDVDIKKITDLRESKKLGSTDVYKSGIGELREEDVYQPMKISKALTMPMAGIKTDVRTPGGVKRKLKVTDKYVQDSADVIIKGFEKSSRRKLTSEERKDLVKDLKKELISKEDVGGITSGYSVTPHWSVSELPRHFTSGKKITIKITDRPAWVVAKSMFSEMGSCETVSDEDAMCRWGPMSDVEHRNPVAYFYLGDKKPGVDSPSARVMLRRAHPVTDEGYGGEIDKSKEFIGVAPIVYGSQSDRYLLPYMLQKIAKEKGAFQLPLKTAEAHEGYADSVAHHTEDVFPFLREEFIDKLDLEDDDYEDEDIIGMLRCGQFKDIPDVFTREFKKPSSIEKPPTFKESRREIIAMSSGRLDKPKAVPRSFFYNLLRSEDPQIRLETTMRPGKETKWQKTAIKDIKGEISHPSTSVERKRILVPRLERATKQLKKYEEIEPKHYHQMAGDPYLDIRTHVAGYPRLEQRTVEQLLPSESLAVQKKLFINPALTYKQRKHMFQEKENIMNVIPLEEPGPRVSMELYKMGTESQRTRLASQTTQPSVLLKSIEEGTVNQITSALENPATPEAFIHQYLISSKRNPNTVLELVKGRRMSQELNKRIYNLYPHNEAILKNLMSQQNLSIEVKQKIESKMLKSSNLRNFLVRNLELFSAKTLKKAIEEFTKEDLGVLTQELKYEHTLIQDVNSLIQPLVYRYLKDPELQPFVFSTLEKVRNVEVEDILFKLLSDKKMTKHGSEVLRFLMKTSNNETKEKLIKQFG